MASRRDFFTQSALAVGATPFIADIFSDPFADQEDELKTLFAGKTVLFQGDSITDAGRRRKSSSPNDPGGLGAGYAGYIAAQMLGKYPSSDMKFFNRGISGNKVFQLQERWQADCIDLVPNVMSILIGVNDYWHTFTHQYEGTAEVYETDLRTLLHRTQKAIPGIQFIICEPFALAGGTAIPKEWNFDVFSQYQEASRIAALDFAATFIPFQSIFNKALKIAPVSHWCPDGVHPSPAGNYLMANAWIKAFKKL